MKSTIEFIKRFWFVLMMAILFVTLLFSVAFGQGPEATRAIQLLEHDQSSRAVEVMKQAVNAGATPELLFYFGYVQLKTGDREAALQSFEKGIAMDDKDPVNYAGKGYAKFLENNLDESKLNFDKALSISKTKNVVVLKTVAEAYLTDQRFVNDALKLLEKAKSLSPDDPYPHILLGDAFVLQNNGGLAVASYERAAKLAPKSGMPFYKMALVYVKSKNYQVAIESLNAAITIDPSFTLAYKELGELYYMRKEGEKAVKAYESYLSLTDKPEIGRIRYAFFLFMAKNYAAANEVFNGLVQKEDVSPITLRFYAFSLFEAGDYQQSRNVFEKYFTSVSLNEIEANDYAYYGKLLLKQSEDSLAIEGFRKSIALDRDQLEIHQLMAETLFKNKRYPEAIDAYKTLIALRQKPTSQDFYSIGRAYYFMKQFEDAGAAFTKLIELQPNMTVGYLWEARAMSNLDPESEQGLAKPYYEKLIEKASGSPEKSKQDLIEAYSYLGYYHFIKEENSLSKDYWTKVVALNPADEKAKEALKALQ
jgi:tetratricopeptide (TPR) repeat protein